MQQAKDGIEALKPHVDTLLVINNDKLRMQYGNLKMKEAFGKADNVLATAAKCITDIINSKGHIIVDFADVCTVMKNGGVAILGSAAVEGEDRAQQAIEEALSSPLLNDNEIKGAKWILININSAEGDYECTMDEIDLINEYLRTQTGEHTDVIVGMGIDNSLDKKIGITIVATGFHHKDPFTKQVVVKEEPKVEKIVLTLGELPQEIKAVEPVAMQQQAIQFEDKSQFEPQLIEEVSTTTDTAFDMLNISYSANDFDAQREEQLDARETEIFELEVANSELATTPYFGSDMFEVVEEKNAEQPAKYYPSNVVNVYQESIVEMSLNEDAKMTPSPTLLSKPSNIYSSYNAQPEKDIEPVIETVSSENTFELTIKETPVVEQFVAEVNEEEAVNFEVNNKEESYTATPILNVADIDLSEEEEQRKRALERIQKLRNLSFNMNSTDTNTEFDNVPAYVRRNMELFGNTLATVENFYSKTTVGKDDNNQTVISTKNAFLDGQRPD